MTFFGKSLGMSISLHFASCVDSYMYTFICSTSITTKVLKKYFFENLAKLFSKAKRVSFYKHSKTIALGNPDIFWQLELRNQTSKRHEIVDLAWKTSELQGWKKWGKSNEIY